MHREHVPDRPTGAQSSTESPRVERLAPGKRTLTKGLVVQRREAAAALGRTVASPPTPPPIPADGGTRPTLQMLFGVQRVATAVTEDSAQVHAAAARGTTTPATRLPYADQIQRAFGRHDISRIEAHMGPEAAASAREMGARAYATGDHVVLGRGTDLHTVAHEAAHVVQQRAGVHLSGGVGEVGDEYERHADEIADGVVAGRSVEDLLDRHAGPASGTAAATNAIQRAVGTMGGTWDTNPYTPKDNNYTTGVFMTLNFHPNACVNATKIGLVQTARSIKGGVPHVILDKDHNPSEHVIAKSIPHGPEQGTKTAPDSCSPS